MKNNNLTNSFQKLDQNMKETVEHMNNKEYIHTFKLKDRKQHVETFKLKDTTKRTINTITNSFMILLGVFSTYKTFQGFSWSWLITTVTLFAGTFGTIMTATRHPYAGAVNMIQNVSNIFVTYKNRIFGDMFMSVYYWIMEATSLVTWNKHKHGNKVDTTNEVNWLFVIGAVLFTGLGMGGVSYLMGGQMILLDSINNATGAVAQYMQKVNRQTASWYLWGVTNVIGIIIFSRIGNVQMAVMYGVFLMNTVRGYIMWSAE